MSRPTTRVLTVLELLQTHRRLSGSELARRLEVDARTVRRYIVALEEIGIPITAEQGRDGGYALVSGFKLPPMMFTNEEALALSVGLLASRSLGLADASVAAASAQAKLERVMPAMVKQRLSSVAATVTLDLARPATPTNGAVLAALSAAAQSRLRVTMTYRTRAREYSQRDVDPYGLAYRGGSWYLVGHCHLRAGLRSFRLDRVDTIRPTSIGFVRPEPFDVVSHLRRSLAVLPRAHAIEVLLKTDLASAQRRLFGAFGLLECCAGGVLLRSQADDLGWFARELAGLPFPFEIRQPLALRDTLSAVARQLLGCAHG